MSNANHDDVENAIVIDVSDQPFEHVQHPPTMSVDPKEWEQKLKGKLYLGPTRPQADQAHQASVGDHDPESVSG